VAQAIEQHAPPDQPRRVTLVALKRGRSSARSDAGRSAICLSSNRHDRANAQQTSGVAGLAGRGAVGARGGAKSKSSTRSDKVPPRPTVKPGRRSPSKSTRAYEIPPYLPTGQWSPVTAYRKNLKSVIIAPALFMWNVEKT
jgi:hypothetical protein